MEGLVWLVCFLPHPSRLCLSLPSPEGPSLMSTHSGLGWVPCFLAPEVCLFASSVLICDCVVSFFLY